LRGRSQGGPTRGIGDARPKDGLVINNLTQKRTFTLPGAAFESSAKEEEIFVFCASRSLTDELLERFGAIACVEIGDISAFCARIQYALPTPAVFPGPRGRTRIGHRVQYYDDTEAVNPRWALPDVMATSKPASYAWQDEFRLVFSLTDALDFEKVITRVVHREARRTPDPARHHSYLVNARKFCDICRIVPND